MAINRHIFVRFLKIFFFDASILHVFSYLCPTRINILHTNMKKLLLLTAALAALTITTTHAQNPQMGDYGYLYCHMNGNGRAWTAYTLSRDGLHYHDLLRGDALSSRMRFISFSMSAALFTCTPRSSRAVTQRAQAICSR